MWKEVNTPNPRTRGNINTNSTSKIKKIKAIKKKRIEKGNRALNLGEKPHSKGLSFSRSEENFFPKTIPNLQTTPPKTPEMKTLRQKRLILMPPVNYIYEITIHRFI